MIYEQVSGWDDEIDQLWIGCSGNFTLERALFSLGHPIHSCDVTIYTAMLGDWLSGGEFTGTLTEKAHRLFPQAAEFQETQVDKVATGLLLAGAADFVKDEVNNAYYKRMIGATNEQWESRHEQQVIKLANMSVALASYSSEDLTTWLPRIPATAGFVSFPPFWSEGYDKMFENLNTLYEWEDPEFEDISSTGADGETSGNENKIIDLLEGHPHWVLMSNERIERLEDLLFARSATTSLAVPIWGYAYPRQSGTSRNMTDRSLYEPVLLPRLQVGMEIGEDISLILMSIRQFRTLRAQYMDPRIEQAYMLDRCFGVVVGDRIVGAFASMGSAPGSNKGGTCEAYAISDFAVGPTDYKHLSKLIVMAIA